MVVDGYARVVTDDKGEIIHVYDVYFTNENLSMNIGTSEIKDGIDYIETNFDSEVLLIIKYHYEEAHYSGGNYHDPDERFDIVASYVLQTNYKEELISSIRQLQKEEYEFQYPDPLEYSMSMIEFYEEIYDEKFK